MEQRLAAQQIELEHRKMDNLLESDGTLQKMLSQPYVGPAMIYQKKSVLPRETKFLQKAVRMDQRSQALRSHPADGLVR